ncbi:MAG: SdrD B-like domain-containing protein, partial [Candidatus Promineifilaceae bacterium]
MTLLLLIIVMLFPAHPALASPAASRLNQRIAAQRAPTATFTIDGTVREDTTDNGTLDGMGNGQPSSATLYVYLVNNTTRLVTFKSTVNLDGTFSIAGDDITTYSLILTSDNLNIGDERNSSLQNLPTGWAQVGKANDTDPISYNTTTADGTISLNTLTQNWTGLDFAIRQETYSVSGTVFEDVDRETGGADGTGNGQPSGQALYVYLTDLNAADYDEVVYTTTVSADGTYTLTNIDQSEYYLYVTTDVVNIGNDMPNPPSPSLPGGWLLTVEDNNGIVNLDDKADGRLYLNGPRNGSLTNINTGITPVNYVSGTVLEDLSIISDGVGDLPPTQGAYLVYLRDLAGDIVLDPVNNLPIAATTRSDGTYYLNDIPAGDYEIVLFENAGFDNIADADVVLDGGNDSDANPTSGDNLIPVTLIASETDTGNHFVVRRQLGECLRWEEQSFTTNAAFPNGAVYSLGGIDTTVTWTSVDANGSLSPAAGEAALVEYYAGLQGGHGGFMGLNMNNAENDQADYVEVVFTFDTPFNNLEFDVLDIDVDSTDGTSFVDAVEVYYNGTNNLRDNTALYAVSGVSNDEYTGGGLYGFKGKQPEAHYAHTTGNLVVDFGTTAISDVTIRYYSGPDANADPTNQYIGITDFCIDPRYDVSGTIFWDADRLVDGAVDGTGIGAPSGQQLYAYLIHDFSNIIVASMPVNADGTFIFANRPIGVNYDVEITTAVWPIGTTDGLLTLPSGWGIYGELNGQSGVIDTTPGGNVGLSRLTADVTNVDFGIDLNVEIGSQVWQEDDCDGNSATGNITALAGVTVEARNSSGATFTGLTDANGIYTMTVPANATYTVTVATPSGLQPSGTLVTSSNISSDPDGRSHDGSGTVVIVGAEHNRTIDFGFVDVNLDKESHIGNTIWGDSNRNGIQDDDGTGIEGVVVGLYADSLTPGLPPIVTTTTDANGVYTFTHSAGDFALETDYVIRLDTTQPALTNYAATVADNTGDNATDSDGVASTLGGFTTYVEVSITSPSLSNDDLTYDFGFYQDLGAIGSYIWLDENGDGEQDAGERGIPNLIVNLSDSKGIGRATTTDAQGRYLFGGLPQGTYTVTVPANGNAALDGLNYTTSNPNGGSDFGNQNPAGYVVTVGRGEPLENLSADFGYNYNTPAETGNPDGDAAALGDRVWVDSNGDGKQNPSEMGVSGAQVTLYHDSDSNGIYNTVQGTATTDANGYYLFDSVPSGAYVAALTNSESANHILSTTADYTQTGDPDQVGRTSTNPDNRTTDPVILGPGDVLLNGDFGYQPTGVTLGSIGDRVWFDADASGGATIDAGEYGIAGVSVVLIEDVNGNGIREIGDEIIAVDITDANGSYLFENLPIDDGGGDADADYIIWANDTGNILNDLMQTYDEDLPLNDASIVAISAGMPNALTQDFSYTPLGHSNGAGLIGDTIWLDLDNSQDATQGADESGIKGVIVMLIDGGGNVHTTTTDENGNYYFGGLDPNGTYTVTISPANFTTGVLQGMAETYDPDGGTASQSVVILSADPDKIVLNQDFSYLGNSNSTLGSIGNRVWLDQNANGNWDGTNGPDGIANTDDDEIGIAGITIDLYRDQNGNGKVDSGEPVLATDTTDGNGLYLFDSLPMGDYAVAVADAAGLLNGNWHSLGSQDASTNGGNDGNDQSKTDPFGVTLDLTTPDNLNVDFGYYVEPAAVGNFVWGDLNGNGVQDAGESGMDNVLVSLRIRYPDGTDVTVTTLTGDDPDTVLDTEKGWYRFDNLLIDEDYVTSTGTLNPAGGANPRPAYIISAETPSGYNPTTTNAAAATNDLDDSDIHAATAAQATLGLGNTVQISTATSEADPTASYDFGYVSTTGAIGNYVWLDENGDGYQNAGERGIPNAIVNLNDSSGMVLTATTDSHGGYLFVGLVRGTYTVTIPAFNANAGGALEGLTYTTPNPNDGGDFGNQDPNGYIVTLDELASMENLTADFGYNYSTPTETDTNTGNGAIGDRLWVDSDGDGRQDPNELGVAGAIVTLYHDPDGNGIYDTVYGTVTTDDNGHYIFDELPPAGYVVAITDDAGASHDVLTGGDYAQTGDLDEFGRISTNPD